LNGNKESKIIIGIDLEGEGTYFEGFFGLRELFKNS
jgi:hypothetical protein